MMIYKYINNLRHYLILTVTSLFLLNISFAANIQPDQEWWTAIKNDRASTVQELLLKKVDTSAFNEIGNPALIQAVREQSWEVFDLLSALPDIDIDQANAYGETALMYLCILGETNRAQKLISKGAHVNRLGWTPLHYAASKAQEKTAQMLIDKGAIVNAPGTDGTTPLMMAALSGKEGIVRLLMDNGADATMHNTKGETAADWAKKNNNNSLAKLLEDVADQVEQQRTGNVNTSSSSQKEAKQSPSATSENGSTSKYFDLDRFD